MRLPRWTNPADLVLALVLLVAGLLELEGDIGLGVAAAALVALPLAARGAAPLAVALVVGAGFVLSALQESPPEPLSQLVAFLVATYSLAAYASLRETVAGAAGLLALALAEAELVGDGDHLFVAVLLAVALAAGRALGSGRRREETLAAQRDAALADERARIARELHDVVAHGVTMMVMQAGAADELLERDAAAARRALSAVQEAGREAVSDLQRMLGLLRSAPVDGPQPGLDELGALVASLRASGLDVDATLEPTGELPAALDLTAYRVAQEALTNALRHGAGSARLRVARADGAITVEVENPAGATARPGAGHGLLGMRERVAVYGGTLEAGSDAGTFRILATLPAP